MLLLPIICLASPYVGMFILVYLVLGKPGKEEQ